MFPVKLFYIVIDRIHINLTSTRQVRESRKKFKNGMIFKKCISARALVYNKRNRTNGQRVKSPKAYPFRILFEKERSRDKYWNMKWRYDTFCSVRRPPSVFVFGTSYLIFFNSTFLIAFWTRVNGQRPASTLLFYWALILLLWACIWIGCDTRIL